jgi:hypothetical protein
MKKLPEKFNKNGFQFEQLNRNGLVALFKKTKPGGCIAIFEVVIIQEQQASEYNGIKHEEKELMPPTASWGKLGWTFSGQESAEKFYSEIVLSEKYEN